MNKKIHFQSSTYTLVGNISIPVKYQKKVGVLILHGAGTATKERFLELQAVIAQEGYPSMAFDFRGVGESGGIFAESSLSQRLEDAMNAFDVFSKYVEQVVILGTSMGAHVATRLTENREAAGLILLYGAAYAQEAEDKLFDESFTAILRRTDSWKTSPAFPALENFNAPSLVIYGQKDLVIPFGVQQEYKRRMQDVQNFIELPNAQHLIFSPKTNLEEDDKVRAIESIIRFLNSLQ